MIAGYPSGGMFREFRRMILRVVRYWTRFVADGPAARLARGQQYAFGGRVTGKMRPVRGGAGKRSRGCGFAMVRYIDADGDEHYAGLAEAALVPFENGRMARNIPAYRDSAHTPGRYWAATTGELVEFESHLEEKWLTLLDFDAGITGFSSQPMELESADEAGGLEPETAASATALPTCVPFGSGQAPPLVCVGSQTKNVTVPVGVPSPDCVACTTA